MKLDYINEENKFNEDEFEELTEDEIYLNKGADAYQAGDYETAIRLYQKSADMGNITALSNLGYCYYYGRSIPIDKTKAKECWDKAAIFGDIPSVYKLGEYVQVRRFTAKSRLFTRFVQKGIFVSS